VFSVSLETKEGFKFDVDITNVKGKASFTSFGGKGWKYFASICMCEPDNELYFTIDEHGPTTKVMYETYPIIHPCMCPTYFFLLFLVILHGSSATSTMEMIMLLHNQHQLRLT
jgi:hypothetical protein